MLPLFAGVVVVLTWAEWDFLHDLGWTVVHEHGVNYPSSLARGDLGAVQALNFAALGVLAFLFARGLRTQFVRRRAGILATGGFGAVALGGLLSAFPTDLPGEPTSWHGLLHGADFVLLMLGNLVAFVSAGLALRGAPGCQDGCGSTRSRTPRPRCWPPSSSHRWGRSPSTSPSSCSWPTKASWACRCTASPPGWTSRGAGFPENRLVTTRCSVRRPRIGRSQGGSYGPVSHSGRTGRCVHAHHAAEAVSWHEPAPIDRRAGRTVGLGPPARLRGQRARARGRPDRASGRLDGLMPPTSRPCRSRPESPSPGRRRSSPGAPTGRSGTGPRLPRARGTGGPRSPAPA